MINQVIQGDCYELMKSIPDGSIDAVISDFPYNTTNSAWDKQPIDLPLLWQLFKRIIKPGGVVVTTASQPFTTVLISSNYDWFRYEWIWDKALPTGHLDAKWKPLKRHESILVFSGSKPNYNPIMRKGKFRNKGGSSTGKGVYHDFKIVKSANDDYYPTTILSFSNANQSAKKHPNQKPLDLFEYLIKTYSNPNETILDPFCGSGTTAIAAYNTNRNFLCFEKEQKYVDIANKRLAEVQQQPHFDEMAG